MKFVYDSSSQTKHGQVKGIGTKYSYKVQEQITGTRHRCKDRTKTGTGTGTGTETVTRTIEEPGKR